MNIRLIPALLRFSVADARGSRGRLLAFSVLLALGLSMLVAIRGTVSSIRLKLDETSREMLGGDLVIVGKEPVPDAASFESGTSRSVEVRFRTMVHASGGGTTLAQIRGVDAAYPLYGELVTEPRDSGWRERGGALVDRALLDRLDVRVGDTVEVFGRTLPIAAELVSGPGDFGAGSVLAPRFYLPRELIPSELLAKRGSLVDYNVLMRADSGTSPVELARRVKEKVDLGLYTVSTAAERTDRMSSSVSGVGSLASTVAVAATLLGLMGAAIAVRYYLRARRDSTAILKCVGATASFLRWSYGLQVGLLAATSGILGAAGGTLIHLALRRVATRAFGSTPPFGIDWSILFETFVLVLLILFWAAWPGLALLIRTPALRSFRSDVEPVALGAGESIAYWGSAIVLLGVIWILVGAEKAAAILLGGIVVGGVLIAASAAVIRRVFERISHRIDRTDLRLALRNTARPGNQTISIVAALTLALGLTITLSIVTETLDRMRGVTADAEHSNLFVYELNPEQASEAETIISENGGTFVQRLPVILMRLRSIRGEPISAIVKEKPYAERWSFTREYWTSYRGAMQPNETIVAGDWVGSVAPGTEPIPISLDDDLAERWNVGIGDSIDWEIQGVPIRTVVANRREILWERLERNSFVVFPSGTLEDAPQFLFWSVRVPTAEGRGVIARELSRKFPNVSVVDLTIVVDQVLVLLNRVGAALRILLGLVVLVAVSLLVIVALGARAERVGELGLLDRLGMRQDLMRRMIGYEYLALGIAGSLLGLVIGTSLGAAVAHFGFKQAPVFPWGQILLSAVGVVVTATSASLLVTSRRTT